MKKIKILALIMVFAFAALGGAYAMWKDTLVVSETVNTGVLDVEWSNPFCVDPSPNYAGHDGNVYGTDENRDGLDTMDLDNPNDHKNIGSLDAIIEEYGSKDKVSNNDKLTITLENGYPDYQEVVFATINNVGTVPAKFKITGFDKIPSWLDVKILAQDLNGGSELIPPLEGRQLDPNDSLKVMIVTRVLSNAPQDVTKSFTLALEAVQWNNYADDGYFDPADEIQFPRYDNYPFPKDDPQC